MNEPQKDIITATTAPQNGINPDGSRRTVLVTGSSRGMGRAEALTFAKQGYDVIVHYAGNKAKADETAEEIRSRYGVRVEEIQANLTKKEDLERLGKKAVAAFGHIDVLVNNAGYALYGPVKDKTIDNFDKMMRIHLYAPFYLTKLLAPAMVERGFGRVINIGTIDVMKTYNAESAEYDAAKAALLNLTKTMSLAYQPVVNVNCVCPGWMDTDMTRQNPPELNKTITSRISKGRFGRPEEVAGVVAFLASDAAEYIDGEVICVDGGYKLV